MIWTTLPTFCAVAVGILMSGLPPEGGGHEILTVAAACCS